MLDKKTDFPQSQSVQNGVENLPLLFDREFILEDGQEDVRLFGDSYFVLDVGAAIGPDDFRSQNPGPDKFFVTTLAKRVFVDLEEMRRTAFVRDILYFLDAPNYQQALFISKENAGDTISLKNCRGLASAISLFDWDKLMGDLGGIAKDLAKNTSNIQGLTAGLKEAGEKIDVNAKGIAVNAQNIAQRLIAPQNTNWFLQASEDTEGMEYFLDNASSEAVLEISSAQVFNGAISSPFVFSGDAQIFLRARNGDENSKNLSVELLVNGVSAGTAQHTLNPGAEFSTVNIKIPSVKIDAPTASFEAPYAIDLRVEPESGVSFLAGGVQTPSLMQFQGGGEKEYILPPATENILGGVKVGSGLVISKDGLLTLSGGGGGNYAKMLTPTSYYYIVRCGKVFFQTFWGHKQIGIHWSATIKKDYVRGSYFMVYVGKDIPLDIFFGSDLGIVFPTTACNSSKISSSGGPYFQASIKLSFYGEDPSMLISLDYENKANDFDFTIAGLFINPYAII